MGERQRFPVQTIRTFTIPNVPQALPWRERAAQVYLWCVSDPWNDLVERLRELNDFASAIKLLEWDQAVMMPANGAQGRARTAATLEGAAHARFTDPEMGALIEKLRAAESLDDDQRASIRIVARDYDKAVKVPAELVKALAEARGLAYQAWTTARPEANFSILEPHLTRLVALKKEEADAIGHEGERYDALLDMYEPGMTTTEVAAMFEEVMTGLKPLVEEVLAAVGDPPFFLAETYAPDQQMDVCRWLVEKLNFELDGGRLDESPHPFTIQIGPGDVRQTTRPDDNDLLMSIYAAIHETGHALYEQGLPAEILDLPIGRFPSLGMHESQSRLWENHVGRSRPFTDFLLPHLKERWPEQLGMVTPEEFHRGVNYPRRTLIRVRADELTYNLHVGLRFSLELALFRDELEVADLPDAWDQEMEDHLGIRPPSQAEGVLQDMHWSIGAFGYFPTYTLGTIYSAALYKTALEDIGPLDDELRSGATDRLLAWLREKVHAQGYRHDAKVLAEKIVGERVTAAPLLAYLNNKYRGLYSSS
jgi:carboxypeptidase Taq